MEHELAAIVDAGACHQAPTTVIDLTAMGDGGEALVIRLGRGDIAVLGLKT
jgi:tRNA A37 threonylcarbamoyladenosine synthetase subunit TsaC/SUA5/YrdC